MIDPQRGPVRLRQLSTIIFSDVDQEVARAAWQVWNDARVEEELVELHVVAALDLYVILVVYTTS